MIVIINRIVFCLLISSIAHPSVSPSVTLNNQLHRTYSFRFNPSNNSLDDVDAVGVVGHYNSESKSNSFDDLRNHPMNQCMMRNSLDSLESNDLVQVNSFAHIDNGTQTPGVSVKDAIVQTDPIKKKKISFCKLLQMICCCSWC